MSAGFTSNITKTSTNLTETWTGRRVRSVPYKAKAAIENPSAGLTSDIKRTSTNLAATWIGRQARTLRSKSSQTGDPCKAKAAKPVTSKRRPQTWQQLGLVIARS